MVNGGRSLTKVSAFSAFTVQSKTMEIFLIKAL